MREQPAQQLPIIARNEIRHVGKLREQEQRQYGPIMQGGAKLYPNGGNMEKSILTIHLNTIVLTSMPSDCVTLPLLICCSTCQVCRELCT